MNNIHGQVSKISVELNDLNHYSRILTNSGEIIYFNSKTIINGCKYHWIKPGDKVIVRNVITIDHPGKRKFLYATSIEIKNLVEKWENILEEHGHIKLSKIEYNNVIHNQEFNLESPYFIKNQSQLFKCIEETKFKNTKQKSILELYAAGYSLRQIAKMFNYKAPTGPKFIIDRYLKMWGLK